MNEKPIVINRKWAVELLRYKKEVEKLNKKRKKEGMEGLNFDCKLAHLFGYIESIEMFLEE